jgi:1-acyl-sn-glycerol-3-phosphate acyltransferase
MSIQSIVAGNALTALGWEFVGGRPKPRKFVGLAVPHTANMDGLLMVLMAQKVGLEMSWMVKDAVDKPVLGQVVRRVGGVFIDRSAPHGVVDQMIHQFEQRDEFCLMIPPEGTRSRRDYWKSGFYHIALGAHVPVVPGFLDYKRKRGGFGDPIELTGDVHKDMDVIRAFYEEGDYGPCYPDKYGPIRLREEEEADS